MLFLLLLWGGEQANWGNAYLSTGKGGQRISQAILQPLGKSTPSKLPNNHLIDFAGMENQTRQAAIGKSSCRHDLICDRFVIPSIARFECCIQSNVSRRRIHRTIFVFLWK